MNLGWTEILLIGGIALLVFGPNKLPSLGRSMGEAIRGFKKGISDDGEKESADDKAQISQNSEQPLNQQEQKESEKGKNS